VYSINSHTIVIGASIGIAIIDHRSGGNAADIMRYADMALYRAKNEGRNGACIYDSVMDADLSKRKLASRICARRSTKASSMCCTNRSSTPAANASSGSRRWRAGRTRPAA
jgi:predicted signal transduction protein with EAL and GGDEF domain